MVRDLASSSVQLVVRKERIANSELPPVPNQRIASGTLIWPNIVLCAAHTLENFQDMKVDIEKDVEILMFFECTAQTSPAGNLRCTFDKWPKCNVLATDPQAKVTKLLELGNTNEMDYGLLEIDWKSRDLIAGTNTQVVTLPRIPMIPRPGRRLSTQLVLIGHPWDTSSEGEPTQATVGNLNRQWGPNPYTEKGQEYGYASFCAFRGFSGGGIFNDAGELVGILSGEPKNYSPLFAAGKAFLELGSLASKKRTWKHGKEEFTKPVSDRIRSWFSDAPPLNNQDPHPNAVFRK